MICKSLSQDKAEKVLLSSWIGGDAVKIYDYNGQANISGDRIHQARTARRLSQDALAAKMQVAGVVLGREAISRIETGDRFVTDYELAIFARVLEVSLDWLAGDIEE